MTKNITFSANAVTIARARQRATRERRTLNEVFRDWLTRYAGSDRGQRDYDQLMKRLDYANAGRHFSRDDLNERSVAGDRRGLICFTANGRQGKKCQTCINY